MQSCLQCRACESICPAHVEYGRIIEGARAILAQAEPPDLLTRTLAYAATRPRFSAKALSMAGGLARALPIPGRHAARLRASIKPVALSHSDRTATMLFLGCVARSFEADAHADLLFICAALGVDLFASAGQVCCGAIHRHIGKPAEAENAKRTHQSLFQRLRTRTVVALDSGCLDALQASVAATTEIVEACEWLLRLQPLWQGHLHTAARRQRVGVFLPCTHRRRQQGATAVKQLLDALPHLDCVEIDAGFGCCGSAGPHLLSHAHAADAFALPIVAQIAALELDAVATTNVGCALHLQERLGAMGIGRHGDPAHELRVRHPVAFLRESLNFSSP